MRRKVKGGEPLNKSTGDQDQWGKVGYLPRASLHRAQYFVLCPPNAMLGGFRRFLQLPDNFQPFARCGDAKACSQCAGTRRYPCARTKGYPGARPQLCRSVPAGYSIPAILLRGLTIEPIHSGLVVRAGLGFTLSLGWRIRCRHCRVAPKLGERGLSANLVD